MRTIWKFKRLNFTLIQYVIEETSSYMLVWSVDWHNWEGIESHANSEDFIYKALGE